MSMSRITTVELVGALMMMPTVPAARMPASVPEPLSVIDFPIVTAPKPPGSRTLISPPVAVLLIAPANVLQGAVRLHGLASSPTPETQVRVACACAGVAKVIARPAIARMFQKIRFMFTSGVQDQAVDRQRRTGCGSTGR